MTTWLKDLTAPNDGKRPGVGIPPPLCWLLPQRVAGLALLLFAITPGVVWAQSRTAALDPGAYHLDLEIGPVDGLTTVWHAAPKQTAVPLGAHLEFRVKTREPYTVRWQGAHRSGEAPGRSTAALFTEREGPLEVQVEYVDREGDLVVKTLELEVIDTARHPIRISEIELFADRIRIDDGDPNGSTMRYFFRDGSISALTDDGGGRVSTSVKRWVIAGAEVEPAGFAPLVEWRLNGVPQTHLGALVRLQIFTPRQHELEVDLDGAASRLEIETYRVRIAEIDGDGEVRDGEPITLTAETEPPGFEDQVTWLASTKYGGCEPVTGTGSQFTVTFEDTSAGGPGAVGGGRRWLGVKADHAAMSRDHKCLGPDLRPVRALSGPPPATVCREVSGQGVLVRVVNDGDVASPANVSVRVDLHRDLMIVDTAFGVLPALAPGDSVEDLYPMPQCCENGDVVTVAVDPLDAECDTQNNTAFDTCFELPIGG